MTISLASTPITDGQLDLLSEITNTSTPLGSLRAKDFRDACEQDGAAHGGFVHPSRVSAILHERFGELNPRWLSAMWGASCGPSGFMRKTDVPAPIDPTFSRGNGNKASVYRRLVVAA